MFPTRFSFEFFTTYVLLTQTIIRNGRSDVMNESEKIDSNLSLSAAVSFVIKSIKSENVRVVGCNSYFHDDFNKISELWRTDVSLTLLNVEKKYAVPRKLLRNEFILMLMDENYTEYLPMFMVNMMGRIRKHKIMVIFNTAECETNRSLIDLASVLWSNKFLNFIILRDCNTITAEVHSYFPFANGECRQFREANIIKLGTFYFNTTDQIYFHSEYVVNTNEMDTSLRNYMPFFPNKVPLKLNNCEIVISTGIWQPTIVAVNGSDRGIEMDFVIAAVSHINASATVIVDSNSWHGLTQDESEEHTGRLALLKNEQFDMMVGSVPTHYNIYRDFDTSESYLTNHITFVVPTAGVFPSSMILWSMIEKQKMFLLLIVGAVLLLSIFINLLLRMAWKIYLIRGLHTKPKNSFLYSTLMTFLVFLRSLIETSTPTLPENRIIRWLYGMWFGVCLIVTCLFNTTLTSYFTEPGHLTQLKTVQDIVDSNIQGNIQIAMTDLYYPIVSADPALEKYFISKNLNCSVLLGLKLTGMGKAVTFTDVLRAEYISVQWVSGSGERSVQFITEGRIQYAHNLAFYRGNAITERINDLVKRINQSGYWEFQRRRYYNRRLIRIMIRQYLMVYNYHLGLSNDEIINEMNKDFLDTSDSLSREMSDTITQTFETNEQEIIERFVRTDKTLVTWATLSTVFRLWAIGMGAGGIAFLLECFSHYLFKKF